MTPAQPLIAILLATYNGEAFLQEQLDSIEQQSHTHWTVWVSDDGSSDQTLALLKKTQEKWGSERLHILHGPQKGFSANFFYLIHHPAIVGNFFAFSDQDDIWEKEKLARALNAIHHFPHDQPVLYGSRTTLVNAGGNKIGQSTLLTQKPSFANALVQSLASGNTMLFNQSAWQRLRQVDPSFSFASHDWWAYILISGCGGSVVYDPIPTIQYRQHGRNLVGSNLSLMAKWKRIKRLFNGDFKQWNTTHIAALKSIYSELTPQNQAILKHFDALRTSPLAKRLWIFAQSGLFRQTALGHGGLWIAAVCNKI